MNKQEQKKHGYTYRREDRYNVTVFCDEQLDVKNKTYGIHWLKFHGIMVDRPAVLEGFKKFLHAQFPTAKYFNVYGGVSGDYYKRIYL
jgi:hypothetical protein